MGVKVHRWCACITVLLALTACHGGGDGDAELNLPDGWKNVRYEEIVFAVPPGWTQQQPSNCDNRLHVTGYYLIPARTHPPADSGCGTLQTHWDTRDTVSLYLQPTDLDFVVPDDAEAFMTDAGLEGFRRSNGIRLVEYYFPGPKLMVAAYTSIAPDVEPLAVVRTIRFAE